MEEPGLGRSATPQLVLLCRSSVATWEESLGISSDLDFESALNCSSGSEG